MRKVILNNHKIVHENEQEFNNIFKVSLKDYFNPITGFDIIKFDDEIIKSKDNKSMKDIILSSYGQEGVDIIINLL